MAELRSKSNQPPARYFPELSPRSPLSTSSALFSTAKSRLRSKVAFSFDDLPMRITPPNRASTGSPPNPCNLLLLRFPGRRTCALARRQAVQQKASRVEYFGRNVELSPVTADLAAAKSWLAAARLMASSRSASISRMNRASTDMVKIKNLRTDDCVVSGFCYAEKPRRAPGGPSRWSTERLAQWQPPKPELVVEVQYDHFTEGRFRQKAESMLDESGR